MQFTFLNFCHPQNSIEQSGMSHTPCEYCHFFLGGGGNCHFLLCLIFEMKPKYLQANRLLRDGRSNFLPREFRLSLKYLLAFRNESLPPSLMRTTGGTKGTSIHRKKPSVVSRTVSGHFCFEYVAKKTLQNERKRRQSLNKNRHKKASL